MINLDDANSIKKLDPSDMLGLVEVLPEQFEEARKITVKFALEPGYLGKKKPNKIVVTGLGGSAIGGDLLRTYLLKELKIPVLVNRYYHLPEFVGKDTLLLAVSYSGNTEETLSAYKEGKSRGAKIVGLTSGGKLYELCKADKVPALIIPGGFPPRASMGYQFTGIVGILEKLGLIEDKSADFQEMTKVLKSMREELNRQVALEKNPAKKMAEQLYGKIPVVYASQDLNDVVALRWKDQFNENSKSFAVCNVFPELNHNEIVGWEIPAEILKNFIVIYIRDKGENPQVKKRFEITEELIKNLASSILQVWTKGESLLARLFSAIYFGDFVSVYLALLNEVDPTPVKRIEELKKQLVM